eukprot:7389740-Prymnesium_polylepis.1
MEGAYPQLRTEAVDTLYGLAYRLGIDFLVFEPAVRTAMRRAAVKDPIVEKYEVLLLSLSHSTQDGWPAPSITLQAPEPLEDNPYTGYNPTAPERTSMRRFQSVSRMVHDVHGAPGGGGGGGGGGLARGATFVPHVTQQLSDENTAPKRHHLNLQKLSKSWDTRNRMTPDDWQDWFSMFSLELLRESPSPALRGCMALAERSAPLTVELFNAAFVCVWEEMLQLREDCTAHAAPCSSTPPQRPPHTRGGGVRTRARREDRQSDHLARCSPAPRARAACGGKRSSAQRAAAA